MNPPIVSPDPKKTAGDIFVRSQRALMAHAIRATVNFFREKRLELDIMVIADAHDRLKLSAPGHGTTSILQSRFFFRQSGTGAAADQRVLARIFLHRYASKNLARVCIAHELFHLLLELQQYVAANGAAWSPVSVDAKVEAACTQFAFWLCQQHDEFYKSASSRESFLYFPKGLFGEKDESPNENWLKLLDLDAEQPFYKV